MAWFPLGMVNSRCCGVPRDWLDSRWECDGVRVCTASRECSSHLQIMPLSVSVRTPAQMHGEERTVRRPALSVPSILIGLDIARRPFHGVQTGAPNLSCGIRAGQHFLSFRVALDSLGFRGTRSGLGLAAALSPKRDTVVMRAPLPSSDGAIRKGSASKAGLMISSDLLVSETNRALRRGRMSLGQRARAHDTSHTEHS